MSSTKILNRVTLDDGIEITLFDSEKANSSENDRILWTTNLAAISRGKNKSSNPEVRYKSLMKEAEGKKPSRPLEFLPVRVPKGTMDAIDSVDEIKIVELMRFAYFDFKDGNMYTNMRALINIGIPYEKIPYTPITNGFAAFKLKTPMFIWAQLVTHTQISTESQSDRVTEETEYWLPNDIDERIANLYGRKSTKEKREKLAEELTEISWSLEDGIRRVILPETSDEFRSWMINIAPQRDVQAILRALGYPREIYSRAPYYFKMKKFIMTGWLVDDNAWPHFLRERNAYMDDGGPKNWTQPETQRVVYHMRKLLEDSGQISTENILKKDSA